MASRKDLKKDVDYLIFELISECYASINERPDQDLSGYEQIINDIIEMHEDLLSRINQFDTKSGEHSRKYFKNIKIDLADGLKKAYKSLDLLRN